MLKDALLLAEQGLPCFPCRENKAPTCPNGFKAATSDPRALEKLFLEYPGSLIGVPTGIISGFDALDIDPRNKGDEWLRLNEHQLPQTRCHQTRSGGVHFLFKHQPNLKNNTGMIAPGVDVKTNGGYIVWWIASGFSVLNNSEPAAWPSWLLEDLRPTQPFKTQTCYAPPKFDGEAYVSGALRSAADVVARAPEGSRNDTLNRECWSLMRFVNEGLLSVQEMANSLAHAALCAGLNGPEVVATIASAIRGRAVK